MRAARVADIARASTCRKRGFQVAVAVVDRAGVLQVLLRDRIAGWHTVETARRKARTAVSFRTATLELARLSQPGSDFAGLRQVHGAIMLGGGVPIEAADVVVAGIGVSGAASSEADHGCAEAGREALAEQLRF